MTSLQISAYTHAMINGDHAEAKRIMDEMAAAAREAAKCRAVGGHQSADCIEASPLAQAVHNDTAAKRRRGYDLMQRVTGGKA